jgi:hypothetical protein
MSYPGRENLVKSVLTAMPTHFCIVFKMPKWIVSGIDKFRRSFLWRGKELDHVKGGHCVVNWQTCNNMALRLRWIWFNWDAEDMRWKYLLKYQDPVDRALFFSSTQVIIGNGRNTPSWEAKWINGVAPRDIAPSLFKSTRFKIRTVQKELQNDNWIKSLPLIDNHCLIDEYVNLALLLSTVSLAEQNDVISWRWIADGQYSVLSAYECQFKGAFAQFPASKIWKAKNEPNSISSHYNLPGFSHICSKGGHVEWEESS